MRRCTAATGARRAAAPRAGVGRHVAVVGCAVLAAVAACRHRTPPYVGRGGRRCGCRHRGARLGADRSRAARRGARSPRWSRPVRRSRSPRVAHRLRGALAAPARAAVARRSPTWCCSTATARSSTTSRTTATPTLVAPGRRRPRGAGPAARRRGPGRGRHQPVRRRPRRHHARRRSTRSTPGVEELLGPFDVVQLCPHAPARRLRVPQARTRHGRRRVRRRSASSRRACVRDRRHRQPTSRRPRAAGRRGGPGADPGHPGGRGRAPLAGSPRSLAAAVDDPARRGPGDAAPSSVRLDSAGDVLLAGPAVRAVAAGSDRVDLLVGPRGRGRRALLPGVDEVLVWPCPWIDADPGAGRRRTTWPSWSRRLAERRIDRGRRPHLVPPVAAADRAAAAAGRGARGSPRSARTTPARCSTSGTGSTRAARGRARSVAGASLPAFDAARRRRRPARRPAPAAPTSPRCCAGEPYVVLHPGTSVPARAWPADRYARGRGDLAARGHRVVVTGGPRERALTAEVVRGHRRASTSAARTSLARARRGAGRAPRSSSSATPARRTWPRPSAPRSSRCSRRRCPRARWAPYGVPTVLLGDQDAPAATPGPQPARCPAIPA